MATINVDPATLGAVLTSASAGTVIQLSPGQYKTPVQLVGRLGRPGAPIVIRGADDAWLDGGQTVDDFTPRAEEVAREAEAAGKYPGVYPIAHEAQFKIIDCQSIILDGLNFRGCWPTAIWIENSTDITLSDIYVRESTYPVYARGAGTRRLLLDRCTWLQDPTRRRLWRDTYWKSVHGDKKIPGSGGARAFDGSFFLGDDIAGDVEIRHCTVEHAFNGPHVFNHSARPDLNSNIYVHHNSFRWIKDNAIEPEDCATNWWICDNEIFNCHKWFSFEMEKAGYFYVFQNIGYFNDRPGPPDDQNSGGAVFKMPEVAGESLGPLYIFNNSWYLRSSYIKQGAIRDFHHVNNAIQYCATASDACDPTKTFFGKAGEGFTTDWKTLNIEFVNDLVWHREFPDALMKAGYPIQAGQAGYPMFQNPEGGGFGLAKNSPCRGRGRRLTLRLPNGTSWTSATPLDIGCAQTDAHAFNGLRPFDRS